MYDLHSEFDVVQHQKHFINYLEVCIHPDGYVAYAVPSHQEYMINYGAAERGLTRAEFESLCPKEYWANYLVWLMMQTGIVCVWSQGYSFACDITEEQGQVLDQFMSLGLIKQNFMR
jgi:hypothetical protein